MHKRWISLILALVLILGLISGGVVTANAASALNTSEDAIALIKKFEGFTSKPHQDYSQWSIGYGSACNKDDYADGITEAEADKLLRADIAKFEKTINNFATKYNLTLTQNQFDALISFTYNVGSNWVNDSEGAFRNAVVNGSKGSEFIYGIVRWCVAGSGENKTVQLHLVKRRLAEANLYLNGVYSNGYPANYTYVIYDTNLTGSTNTVRIQGYDSTENVKPCSTPSKSGYQFLGWYTEKDGGAQVTALDASTAGKTLYAHWQEGEGKQDEDGKIVGTAASYTRYAAISGKQVAYGQPDLNAEQIRYLEPNQALSITAEYLDDNGVKWGKLSDNTWVNISETSEEIQPTDKLEEPLEVTVTAPTVNLRTGPGTEYDRAGAATKGQKLTIVGTQKGTYFLWGKFDGGWIALEYTDYETAKADQSPDANKVTAIGTIVGANSLNIRSGPGTSYATVGSYKQGEQVYITLQEKVGTTVWYKTDKGWIHSFYVKAVAVQEGEVPDVTPTTPTEPEATKPAETTPETTTPETTAPEETKPAQTISDVGTVVNCTTLRIRAKAGTANAHVGDLTRGTQVVITEYTTVKGVKWGKIEQGWVSMNYIQLGQTTTDGSTGNTTTENITGVVVNCTKVNLRSDAGTQYSKVGELKKGTTVQVLETKKASNGATWAKTSKGWIHTHYLNLSKAGTSTGSGSSTDSSTTTGATGVIVNCTKVNVRANAGTQYTKVTQLTSGTQVQILETTKATNGAVWARTAQGWIHTYYLRITGTVGSTDTTTSGTGSSTTDTGSAGSTIIETGSNPSGVVLTGTVVNTDTLRLRSAAGVSSAVLGTVKKGERLEILETKIVNRTTWGRTAKGWVSLYYVQLDTTTNLQGAVVMTVVTDTLKIRKEAGASNEQVGTYYRGNKIVILEQAVVGGATWGRTDIGWVAMEYLK